MMEQPTDGDWTVRETDGDHERAFTSRQEAEHAAEEAESLGMTVEIIPPGDGDPDVEVVEHVEDAENKPTHPDTDMQDLPERSVADDPLTWIPGEFIDTIDGSQAINRKGFEVLAHFYDVDVFSDLEVAPEDTGHEYCRVKATAVTDDGRQCEAYGSAHIDRDDDATLLLEMADTRARKRALSIATGVGAVAVEELKSEVQP